MAKIITINLIQRTKDEYNPNAGGWAKVPYYIVIKVTNSLDPKVGQKLSVVEAQARVDTANCVVNITQDK